MTAIIWNDLVGPKPDIGFARANLPALQCAAGMARDYSMCVQAGANIGIFPLFLAQYFKFTHCFEPDAASLDYFYENVPSAKYRGKVLAHHAALADRSGRGFLYRTRRDGRPGHSGTHHIQMRDNGRGAEVALETVDGLGLASCGLIYLDIEGFELFAIYGAKDTIERCRPVIGVEINKSLEGMGIREQDVIGSIAAHRYVMAAKFGSDWIFTPAEWNADDAR